MNTLGIPARKMIIIIPKCYNKCYIIFMENKININEWIKKFDSGEFNDLSVNTQIDAGWYDWFCRNASLCGKTKILGKKVKILAMSPKINNESSYVFFKNNCPFNGRLYDDFRICDIKTGKVIFTIVPRSGHTSANGNGEVWGHENGFKEPLVRGSWKDIKQYFNV